MPSDQPTPERILHVGLGFWASKTLLAAIDFGLFTILADGPLTGEDIRKRLKIHPRSLYDFLDALTALGFLQREGLLETARYSNTTETALFLDKNKSSYVGGLLEMSNQRLYPFWSSLERALISGQPQNEVMLGAPNMFDILYKDPVRLAQYIEAMGNFQVGNFTAFAAKFDFSKYKTMVDAGGAGAILSIQVALHHPHMSCISFDLPPVQPLAQSNVDNAGVDARVTCMGGDFFASELPHADVIVMGNILHDWSEEQKIELLKKAYRALPAGGAFVAIENVIDDNRNQNVFGLLMSLNMLIETPGGFDYTGADFNKWALQVGFKKTEIMPVAGPTSAAIAYK